MSDEQKSQFMLLTFDMNWADEFDVCSTAVVTRQWYEEQVANVKLCLAHPNLSHDVEWYFGTNQDLSVEMNEVFDTCDFEDLTDEEAEVIKRTGACCGDYHDNMFEAIYSRAEQFREEQEEARWHELFNELPKEQQDIRTSLSTVRRVEQAKRSSVRAELEAKHADDNDWRAGSNAFRKWEETDEAHIIDGKIARFEASMTQFDKDNGLPNLGYSAYYILE
jgi:hypothetical protein